MPDGRKERETRCPECGDSGELKIRSPRWAKSAGPITVPCGFCQERRVVEWALIMARAGLAKFLPAPLAVSEIAALDSALEKLQGTAQPDPEGLEKSDA